MSDRKLAMDDGIYTYSGGTLTKASTTSDGRLDYYLPDVLTSTDYYPGGMPMPGRTFEGGAATNSTSAAATSFAHGQITFATAGANSYVAIPTGGTVTLANPGGTSGKLTVTKGSTASGVWGVRSGSFTLYQGIPYSLSFAITLGTCSGRIANGWRIVDASGTVFATGAIVSGGTVSAGFTIPGTGSGTYYLEVYRDAGTTGCTFDIDNVQITYATYTQTTVCGTASTANQYAWGHNGQLKDNEIYGSGNAYSAEYWEYDARLLRRWNTDPITYSDQSTYACFNNNPIYFADPLGLEGNNDGVPGGPGDEENANNPHGLPSTGKEGEIYEYKDENGNSWFYRHDGQQWVAQGGRINGNSVTIEGSKGIASSVANAGLTSSNTTKKIINMGADLVVYIAYFANAFASDQLFGLGRVPVDLLGDSFKPIATQAGNDGDNAAIAFGIAEMIVGAGDMGGAPLLTLELGPVGVGAAEIVGMGMVIHGGTTVYTAEQAKTNTLTMAAAANSGVGSDGSEAKDGAASEAAKKARSPHPIGKRINFPSRKKAYEAAKKAGKGEPVLHYDGEHGPHYHPGNGKGKPLNHDHYYFPK